MKTLLDVWQRYRRGVWGHPSTADRHLHCLRHDLRSGRFGAAAALPRL